MKRLVTTLLTALLLLTPLSASSRFDKLAQSVRRLAVTVTTDEGTGEGSCTASSINSERGYWLTAAHCAVGTLKIDGKDAFVRHLAVREDIAILYVPDHKVAALKLSTRDPEVGDELMIIGHPLGMPDLSIFKGYLAGKQFRENNKLWYKFDMAACGGNSGSAVLNADGKVVSVLQFGWGDVCSSFTGGATFQDLVKVAKQYWG